MNKCRNCGKECEKTYCSGACKVAYHRYVTKEPVTDVTTVTGAVTNTGYTPVTLPLNYGLPDCQCRHCINNRSRPDKEQYTINHGAYKSIEKLGYNEINRVSLPGDVDYATA